MKDFVIGLFIIVVTNMFIINPYWDKLKEYWILKGYTAEQIDKPYILICAASYLAIGIITYITIFVIKAIISTNKKQKLNII